MIETLHVGVRSVIASVCAKVCVTTIVLVRASVGASIGTLIFLEHVKLPTYPAGPIGFSMMSPSFSSLAIWSVCQQTFSSSSIMRKSFGSCSGMETAISFRGKS